MFMFMTVRMVAMGMSSKDSVERVEKENTYKNTENIGIEFVVITMSLVLMFMMMVVMMTVLLMRMMGVTRH